MCCLVTFFVGLLVVVGIGLLCSFWNEVCNFLDECLNNLDSVFMKRDKSNAKVSSDYCECYDKLEEELLAGTDLDELEESYNEVAGNILMARDPSDLSRENTSYLKVWKLNLVSASDIKLYITLSKRRIMREMVKDMNLETLPKHLILKMDDVFKQFSSDQIHKYLTYPSSSKFYNEQVCEIDEKGRFEFYTEKPIGGWPKKYKVIFGNIGITHTQYDVYVYVALSFDEWVEKNTRDFQKNVSYKKEIWNKDSLKTFTKYLLVQEVIQEKKKEKEAILDSIIKENGFELYQWLNSIGYSEYYRNFKNAGFEKERTIAKLEEKDFGHLGISKLGHIKDLMIYVNELNQKLKQNERFYE